MSVVLVAVAVRVAWIQVVDARTLSAAAEKQRLRDMTLAPRRGSITDREGEQLAVTVDAKTVYAVPGQVEDATATARTLARTLGGKAQTYLAKLKRTSSFVFIARKADSERAAALQALGISGIGFLDDSRRAYPSGELACQVLGFVGIDDEGLAGLEKYYDPVLAGTPGRIRAERDPQGRIIPGGVTVSQAPVDGRSITLTIDKDVQYEAHVALADAVREFGAKAGCIVVLDPTNGEIYALSSWPYFDPNKYAQAGPEAQRNRVISEAYEPGSTIKSFTAAAVIDQGLFTPQSLLSLPPTLRVGDRTIHEAHARPAVTWSLSQIVTKSSNVGAVKLGMALGKQRLYDYFALFGLTEKTGVDYPGEARGWLPPPKQWTQSSIGNVPFGQGIRITVLQLARAYAVLANGGRLVTPHFLLSESGSTTEPVWASRSVLSSKTAATMRRVLTGVVTDGTGASAAVRGYDVAGKTGTAQVPGSNGVGYLPGQYMSSFAGFLPARDPRLVIVVALDRPRSGIYGGTVAAPAFSRLARFAVAHLKIPPVTAAAAPVNGAVSTPASGREGR
jgi:cell division protein FtsI (penicillin-binding protein 3)